MEKCSLSPDAANLYVKRKGASRLSEPRCGSESLHGPGTDSGTFDYFTEAINGKSHVSRSNYTKSEDDNVLVKGVAGEVGAMGYFGFAYYKENKGLIKALPVDNGKGPVAPSMQTINDGTYAPLSRPIFIYVSKKSISEKKQVREFVKRIGKTKAVFRKGRA